MITTPVNSRLSLLLALAIGLGAVASPAAPPDESDFTAVADRARRLAKDADATPADRTAVVISLAEHGSTEAATLIISVGLGATDPEPRTAARAALVRLADDPRIHSHVFAAYRRASARPGPLAAELAIVLLAAEADDDRGSLRTLLDRAPQAGMLATAAAVCAAAGRAGDPTAVQALRTLARLRCFAGSLACRRGVIATLAGIPGPESIEALVDMMEELRGEARGDAITRLVKVSGENHGTDARAWRAWLQAAADTGARPAPDEDFAGAPAPAAAEDAAGADYYGIPIYADRVVFVLDTSGSMEGLPLEAAKRELESAIFSLPAETFFTIVFFNSDVGPWQRQLVQATDSNKQAAAAFVARLPAQGGTATSDALQAAFTFDTEAIFFLSDGAPSAGRITDPAGIVEFVTRLNEGRYVSVNTISIMGGAAFLETLAQANHGSFRAVDQ